MNMVVPKGWLEEKQHEQEVKHWTNRFNDARNGKESWDVVKAQYLDTQLWKRIRDRIIKRADGQCENKKCRAILIDSSAFDVHHLTYDRIGGNEKDEDLSALCYSCHKKADQMRERIHEEDRLEALYYAKMRGFAESVHGELWEVEHDEDDVEQEWLRWLYKKYCKQEGERYELDDMGRVPDWFQEMVWDDQVHIERDDEYY
jgi:5-methylcytosine-specific restriction endonuclease McrA